MDEPFKMSTLLLYHQGMNSIADTTEMDTSDYCEPKLRALNGGLENYPFNIPV